MVRLSPPYPPPVSPPPYPPGPPPAYVSPPPSYGAPPVPPGFMPAPVFVMRPAFSGSNTIEGLDRLKTASLLGMVIAGLTVVLGIVTVQFFANPPPPGVSLVEMVGRLAPFLAVTILMGIAGLACLVFGLVGLSILKDGKTEFGPEHDASIGKGFRWLLYSVLLGVANLASSIALGLVFGTPVGPFDSNAFVQRQVLFAAVPGAIAIASAYTLAISLESFVERLMTSRGRALRQQFIMMSLVAAAASLALGVAGAFVYGPMVTSAAAGAANTSLGPFASAISVYSIFIYFQQVEKARTGVQNMLSSGSLDPDAGSSAPGAMPVVGSPPSAGGAAPAYQSPSPMPMPPMPPPPP